ncbi:hypothetical protein D3879_14625 [Pseudomonas cavernicola]|uniref:DUF1799 domain-containing protein n=1 Tax=Pseudomonas cavernicola TaxID=2320866 RepID=A0A418XEY8_9PSED|nr:DUF1799 domain-containing protein [Pseudomonas cavernicola]RJG10913.1 hypothetical protein D3879_14625 [Pseudomonas cavernicola]
MEAFGFTREDMGSDEFWVWPDNWQAVDVFITMGTQWRVGMAGATGLDYGVLNDVMRLHGIKKRGRDDVFAAVRIMESAALKVMHEK